MRVSSFDICLLNDFAILTDKIRNQKKNEQITMNEIYSHYKLYEFSRHT